MRNLTVTDKLNKLAIEKFVGKRKLSWLRHICRMNDGGPTKEISVKSTRQEWTKASTDEMEGTGQIGVIKTPYPVGGKLQD